MVPDIENLALVVANAGALGIVAVRYRRGGIDRQKATILTGTCLTLLAYWLQQISQEGPVPTGTTLNYVLGGLEVVCLVAGLAFMYRWWRGRDSAESTATGQ